MYVKRFKTALYSSFNLDWRSSGAQRALSPHGKMRSTLERFKTGCQENLYRAAPARSESPSVTQHASAYSQERIRGALPETKNARPSRHGAAQLAQRPRAFPLLEL
jgi:hypothetical protein